VGFFRRMKVGAGGIVYASAWVLADMDMDAAELGWNGLGWVGNFLCHQMEAGGRIFLSVPSKAALAGTILLGGEGQPVDGWMGNGSFFSRPSLLICRRRMLLVRFDFAKLVLVLV